MNSNLSKYVKGNSMTFPLELTQVKENEVSMDNRYLFPTDVSEFQSEIEDACDRLEYDGSIMYDEYPDKVSVERMAKEICNNTVKEMDGECNRWCKVLIQVMLCNEMNYRRNRRKLHKDKLFPK